MSKYKSKKAILEEQRAKIRQLRAEALNPELKEIRLKEEAEREIRHQAKAKQKIEEWFIMKQLKGEWEDRGLKGSPDLDRIANNHFRKGSSK